jgi:high-affinity iron transporter
MVALLVKAGRRDALSYVHAGWLAALVLGAATWLVASYVVSVSGARREVSEGVTALAAAAILLYVGYWMHGNAYAAHWRAFLDRRLGGPALSGRTAWALAAVCFLAVYREAFETVLLAQALWMQAGASGRPAALAGFATAAVALVGLGWLIVRGSLRLPLGPFFGAASVLLAVLAVALAGKGVAALQEAGMVPVSPIAVPALPLVGLYPSVQGAALQTALVLVIALGFLHANRSAWRV